MQDDAVLEFLTKDDGQRSMGERNHKKRHHEMINQPSSPVNKEPENGNENSLSTNVKCIRYASVHA